MVLEFGTKCFRRLLISWQQETNSQGITTKDYSAVDSRYTQETGPEIPEKADGVTLPENNSFVKDGYIPIVVAQSLQ